MASAIEHQMGNTWCVLPKFFFVAMHRKRKRDAVTKLLLDDGACIIGDEIIMFLLVHFYRKLFEKDHCNAWIKHEPLHSIL